MKISTLLKKTSALLLISNGVLAQIPANGLVGYFPFTGNPNSTIGSSITGTLATGYISANTPPVLTTDRNNVANAAYDFQPGSLSTSYINLGMPTQLNFSTTSAFSISAWIKYQTYNITPTIFGNGAVNYGPGWQLALVNLSGNDHLTFVIGTTQTNKQSQIVSDMVLTPNNWYHVVGVYNNVANTMELYVNGSLATGFAYGGATSGTAGPSGPSVSTATCVLDATPAYNNQIGLDATYPSTGFKGKIDDILVYNRPLTATEVSNINTSTADPVSAGIKEIDNASYFTVWPNPSNGSLNIHTKNIIDELKLKVYDILGNLVIEKENYSADQQIDLSPLNNGNYLIKLESKDGFYTRKINLVK